MIILLTQFAILWTMCSTAKHYNDYYYQPYNSSRTTPVGLAAYRSALTLDWLSAEDSRQRQLASSFEQEPQFPSPLARSECISYKRPSAGSVAKLMLEVLKNLEGDEGVLVANLVQALVRAKLLMVETMMFENEPDFEALVKTPASMIGEPHTTFPRIVEVLWMAITDPSTVKKHGWCTISQMTSFVQASRPIDIAMHMRASEQIISRARFIMEDFIQHVTPIHIQQQFRSKSTTEKPQSPVPLQPAADSFKNSVKRPVRTHPVQDIQAQHKVPTSFSKKVSPSSKTIDDLEPVVQEDILDLADIKKEVDEDALRVEIQQPNNKQMQMMTASASSHQISKFMLLLLLFLY